MHSKWSTKFELKPGKWVFVPTAESAAEGAKIKASVEKNWNIPCFYFHLRSGGHVKAIKTHLKHRYFLHADIQDFFGSINRSRITRHLGEWFPYEVSREMANASTVKYPDDPKRYIVPYGFVQSQAVAGLCLDRSKLGRYLTSISKKAHYAVSVYVDDIIISADDEDLCKAALTGLQDAAAASRFVLSPGKQQGPAAKITAFNIEIENASMRIKDTRLLEFVEAFHESETEYQRQGILSYVKSINADQLHTLKLATGIAVV
jgi:Reverse transcriptase (RNA-dependent DNA polymerase)